MPDWPYALHILGHVVNNDLCVPVAALSLVLCHSHCLLWLQRTGATAVETHTGVREEGTLSMCVRVRMRVRESLVRQAGHRLLILHSWTQGNAELAAVWDLLTALWRRDYPVRVAQRLRVTKTRERGIRLTPSLCRPSARRCGRQPSALAP